MPVEYRDGKPGYVVQATTFGGKPVWKRLWNPEGPPGYNADTEPPPAENGAGGERYDEKSKKLWEQWVRDNLSGRPDRAGTRARFHDGLVPEVPPLREWCVWDF